jgi:hypothetical protein
MVLASRKASTGTKTGMTLAEIERWIGEHIRRRQNVVGR